MIVLKCIFYTFLMILFHTCQNSSVGNDFGRKNDLYTGNFFLKIDESNIKLMLKLC